MSSHKHNPGPFKPVIEQRDGVLAADPYNYDYWLLESEHDYALYLFPPSFNNGWGKEGTWRLIHLLHGSLANKKTLKERLTIKAGKTVQAVWPHYVAYKLTGTL